MIVETPQILWNQEEDKGVNAALLSVSMIASGGSQDSSSHVLATAGNSTAIHLWRIAFMESTTQIDFLCSLSRHEGPVNTVAFSPDGLHLATAGDAGSVIVWSVPVNMRGNGNGRHYWSGITREQDLTVRIVARSGEAVSDLSWSRDSKRFIAGTIDHSVFICEDSHFDVNQGNPVAEHSESDWRVVYRNAMDHTHYVQGVSYDPQGVYMASMSSDRTIRIYPRKVPPKSKKKVLRPTTGNIMVDRAPLPPTEHARQVEQLLTGMRLDIGKSKVVKHRKISIDETGAQTRQLLFADESTLESFFRRLSWTTDGAFLVAPAALWHADSTNKSATTASFATCLFARHRFDEPAKVLMGHEKPSIAVRPNPVLFKLPVAATAEDSKENQSPSPSNTRLTSYGLPYRSIFAVLTWDSVLIYDTFHSKPLAVVRGLHYANLVDATWSEDGHRLVVCSTDGYVSFITFSEGELGEVYEQPQPQRLESLASPSVSSMPSPNRETPARPIIPPCESGSAVLEGPPAKKKRVTPVTVSPIDATPTNKRPAEDDIPAVDKLSLTEETQPKKKKRIQPTLLTATSTVN